MNTVFMYVQSLPVFASACGWVFGEEGGVSFLCEINATLTFHTYRYVHNLYDTTWIQHTLLPHMYDNYSLTL